MESFLLARVVQAVQSESAESASALRLLELIADGRWSQITEDEEASVGLKPGQLRRPAFGEPVVRANAFLGLADTGKPEALAYLSKLKEADFSTDAGYAWRMSQVAIQMMKVAQIANPREQDEFLEAELTKKLEGSSGPQIQLWAKEELCERGVLWALPTIMASLEKWRKIDAPEELEFCRQRMLVVSRGADIDALASLLTANLQHGEFQLAQWAMFRLVRMNTTAADSALEAFAAKIDAYPKGSDPGQWSKLLAVEVKNGLSDRELRAKIIAGRL
jgi:hypothetical protein